MPLSPARAPTITLLLPSDTPSAQVEPYRLRLRERERTLGSLHREANRAVAEKHVAALKSAADQGVPPDLFPLGAPWSLFPWCETDLH